jgi:4,5-DOPA dioxygenase extradiol
MPSLFVAHGSPLLLEDASWVAQLRNWALAIPKPRAILVISAHWVSRTLTLGATTPTPVIHDFYGFPARFYEQSYAAPGAPELARRVQELATAVGGLASESDHGLDHGAYVPLAAMYPQADIPVLQISLPGLEPQALLDLGEALAPLRREGVSIIGSGFLSHNLALLRTYPGAEAPPWALEFDDWIADALARKDVDALLDYRHRAPHVAHALPTHEHFAPVFIALGAAAGTVSFPITGFTAGAMTKRSVQFD